MANKKLNYKQREGMSYVRVVPKFLQGMVQAQEYQGKYDDPDDLEDLPDPELERMKREYLEERLKEEMERDSGLSKGKKRAFREDEAPVVVEEEEPEEEEEGQHRFRRPPATKKRRVAPQPKPKKRLEPEEEEGEGVKGEKKEKEEEKEKEKKEGESTEKSDAPKKKKKKKKKESASLLSFDVDE